MPFVDKSILKQFYMVITTLIRMEALERKLDMSQHLCSEHKDSEACDIVMELMKRKQDKILILEKEYNIIKDYLGL